MPGAIPEPSGSGWAASERLTRTPYVYTHIRLRPHCERLRLHGRLSLACARVAGITVARGALLCHSLDGGIAARALAVLDAILVGDARPAPLLEDGRHRQQRALAQLLGHFTGCRGVCGIARVRSGPALHASVGISAQGRGDSRTRVASHGCVARGVGKKKESIRPRADELWILFTLSRLRCRFLRCCAARRFARKS